MQSTFCKKDCNSSESGGVSPVWCKKRHTNVSLSEGIPAFSRYPCEDSNKSDKGSLSGKCKANLSFCERITEDGFSYFFSPVGQVIRAVQVLAEAIENSAKQNSEYLGIKARQRQVRKYLFNYSGCNYVLPSTCTDEDGVIKYDLINFVSYGSQYYLNKVGSWSQYRSLCNSSKSGTLEMNETNIYWMSESRGKSNESHRGIQCAQNEAKKRREGLREGKCWECVRCRADAIVINNNTKCKSCKRDEKPNRNYTSCIILPRKKLTIVTNWQATLILVLTLIGIGSVFFMVFMFIKYRNTKIIKASGRELSVFILLGALLAFLNSFIFIHPPGKVNCSLRQILPGFAFCLCYAPLFLKVNRIYRIFVNSDKLEKTYFADTKSQVLLVLGIAGFQVIPGCVWLTNDIPDSTLGFLSHRNYVILHCPVDHAGFFLNLILGVGFILGSTWYAFKTRSFPRNFNESKYIGISLYVICICWALFIPSIFFIEPVNEFLHEYMICSICIIVGYTIIAGLFIPKVRRLLNSSSKHKSNASAGNPVTTSDTFSHVLSTPAIQRKQETYL